MEKEIFRDSEGNIIGEVTPLEDNGKVVEHFGDYGEVHHLAQNTEAETDEELKEAA